MTKLYLYIRDTAPDVYQYISNHKKPPPGPGGIKIKRKLASITKSFFQQQQGEQEEEAEPRANPYIGKRGYHRKPPPGAGNANVASWLRSKVSGVRRAAETPVPDDIDMDDDVAMARRTPSVPAGAPVVPASPDERTLKLNKNNTKEVVSVAKPKPYSLYKLRQVLENMPLPAKRLIFQHVSNRLPSLYTIGNLGKAVLPPAYRRGRQAITAAASTAKQGIDIAAPYAKEGALGTASLTKKGILGTASLTKKGVVAAAPYVSDVASATKQGVRRAASASAAVAMDMVPPTKDLARRAASRSRAAAASAAASVADAAASAQPIITDAASRAASATRAAASSASQTISAKATKAVDVIKDSLSKLDLDISEDMANQFEINRETLKKVVAAVKQKAAETPEAMAKLLDQHQVSVDTIKKIVLAKEQPLRIELRPSVGEKWLTTLAGATIYNRGIRGRTDSPGPRRSRGLIHLGLDYLRAKHGHGLDMPTSAKPKAKAKAKAKAKRAPKKAIKPVVEYHDLKDNPYVVKPKLQLPEKPSNKKSV